MEDVVLATSIKHCIMPTLPESALLVKLYYRNNENAAAADKEFRRLKKQRCGLMSECALKDMMVKSEKAGQLGVLPGRERKRTNSAVVEGIATAVVEVSSESLISRNYQRTDNFTYPCNEFAYKKPYSTRWSPTSQSELNPTIVKTGIDRRTCERPIFPNSLASTIARVAAVAEWYRYRIVACHVTSSSPVPLKTHRVGQRCPLNLSRAETSSRWCGS
ncbi:histone-lysine N-methyltransferase SETMAR [Trichonephila clavipes]|nr:histone-lysine N-methyltransferase SETMAR [Trichonephila clavipes]